MIELYAIVPVRVRISSNSAAEIDRAHNVVKSVVEYWQEICVDDFKDNGPELNSNAQCPEEQPSYVFVREPTDPIEVVEVEI